MVLSCHSRHFVCQGTATRTMHESFCNRCSPVIVDKFSTLTTRRQLLVLTIFARILFILFGDGPVCLAKEGLFPRKGPKMSFVGIKYGVYSLSSSIRILSQGVASWFVPGGGNLL